MPVIGKRLPISVPRTCIYQYNGKNCTDITEIQARPLGKTYPGVSKTLSKIHWFHVLYIGGRGLATIDRLLTVPLVVEKL